MLVKLLRILAALLAVVGSTAHSQDGMLLMVSEPGHALGNGQSTLIPFAAADVEAVVVGTFARIRSLGTGPNWSISFHAAGVNEPLRTGCYERAIEGGEIEFPNFRLAINSTGCFSATSRYRLIELQQAPGSVQIQSLALDFAHHCDMRGPAIFGQIRFNSKVPISDQPLEPVFSSVGQLYATGEPGDTVLDGRVYARTLTEQRFTAWPIGAAGLGSRRDRLYLREQSLLDTNPDGRWELGFRAPSELPLAVGVYDPAVDFTFGAPDFAGVCFGQSSWACGADSGRFHVLQLEREPIEGRPIRGRVSFERTLDFTGTRVHGLVDFHTSLRSGPLVADVLHLDGFDQFSRWPLYWQCN